MVSFFICVLFYILWVDSRLAVPAEQSRACQEDPATRDGSGLGSSQGRAGRIPSGEPGAAQPGTTRAGSSGAGIAAPVEQLQLTWSRLSTAHSLSLNLQ